MGAEGGLMDHSLPKPQQKILSLLGPKMQGLGYYLAGGTALAIYYQHRLSVALDWFTANQMGDAMLLARTLQDSLSLSITDVAPGTLHAIANQVRLSFFEYRYPILKPITITNDFNCPLASLDDIACMKLSALAQRGSKKDSSMCIP